MKGVKSIKWIMHVLAVRIKERRFQTWTLVTRNKEKWIMINHISMTKSEVKNLEEVDTSATIVTEETDLKHSKWRNCHN